MAESKSCLGCSVNLLSSDLSFFVFGLFMKWLDKWCWVVICIWIWWFLDKWWQAVLNIMWSDPLFWRNVLFWSDLSLNQIIKLKNGLNLIIWLFYDESNRHNGGATSYPSHRYIIQGKKFMTFFILRGTCTVIQAYILWCFLYWLWRKLSVTN